MHFAKWVCVEHREEVHEEVQRHVGKLLVGMGHRLRKEEMEEQFNKGAKEGWRFAPDAARIKDEDRKQTSGGAFVAVDIKLEAVVGSEEGAVESTPGNEGGIAQA